MAGIAKLRRPQLAAMAIVDFGMAVHARRSLGVAVGSLEVVLAAALASHVFPRAFAGAAALVLATFAVVIGRSLLRGERFACFCFGSAAPLSAWTLTRALLLFALAALVFAHPASALYVAPTEGVVVELVAGASLIGSAALLATFPRLITMNRDVFMRGVPEAQ
jgi:hypothetical protein